MTMDKIILKFKGKVIFWKNIPKLYKMFDTNIYKFSDRSGYIYSMISENTETWLAQMLHLHMKYTITIQKAKGIGHVIFMDNCFSSVKFFNLLHQSNINVYNMFITTG
jgi:hypothetical protein